MKWLSAVVFCAILAVPTAGRAQENLSIGSITLVADRSPSTWGMSGMEMIHVTQSIGLQTPITRTLAWDARTVEILSRTQSPPLGSNDIKVMSRGGRDYVVVRRYLLMEVMSEDAHAAGMTRTKLAEKWAKRVRFVLPQVAPAPNRFGV